MSAILAIDGGGTRTRAGLYDQNGTLLAEAEGDATNLSTNAPSQVVQTIVALARQIISSEPHKIISVVAGISGAGRTGTAQSVATRLAKAINTTDIRVCSDAHMMSWANLDADHPVLVIAGTGSAVISRRQDGSRVVTGGWGPILGDEGGAYRLAVQGICNADEDEQLRRALLEVTGHKTLPELHRFFTVVPPRDIAELASVVTRLAEGGNEGALLAINDQAGKLASLMQRGLKRVGYITDPSKPLRILVTGGLMDSPIYLDAFTHIVSQNIEGAHIERPRFSGHRAAFELLRLPLDTPFLGKPDHSPKDVSLPSTEQARESGHVLDRLDAEEIAQVLGMADSIAVHQVIEFAKTVAPAIETAAACLRAGGRIIYAGAGTSGRLGVLDASECPPTFGVSEDRVIGLIAGGDKALRHSIEGAEDDTAAGARDIDSISPRVGKNDIVIGITASGTTPYPLAAIDRGKALGAKTALVCCNPAPLDRADIVIALDTGPEVLPGSTRLKAGTATKLVLNQISTGAMAKAGYVFEGRMVGVQPSNKKLRQRCIRIIAELTKEDAARAEQRLDETKGSIRLAVLMARKGLSLAEATRRLDACWGVLRDALEMK